MPIASIAQVEGSGICTVMNAGPFKPELELAKADP
jgi:hypothetical protein